MLKALIRKELTQLNQFYIYSNKTKKLRSKKSIAGMIVLFFFIFASCAFAFFGMDMAFSAAFFPMGYTWLYFSLTGLIAIVAGVFGDIFTTFTLLYKSKDNDLLLSMPIPPSSLLAARILGVFIMGMLYESIVFIPAMVVYWMNTAFSVQAVLFPIIIWLTIGILVTVLTCVLGWVVAVISVKLSNKNITKALTALAFLVLYYVVYFKAMKSISTIGNYADDIAETISGWMFLSYHMGLGCAGNVSSLLIFVGISLALFAITYAVMTKTYIRITTTVRGNKKIEYHTGKNKSDSVFGALIKKELTHFLSSTAYMMNMGLGLFITFGLAVFALIKMSDLRAALVLINQLAETIPWITKAIPVVVALAPMMVVSMNLISAPSLSLEGKNIWILQSSPVDSKTIFKSKLAFHIIMCSLPTLLLPTVLAVIFKTGLVGGILAVLFEYVYMLFVGVLGLWLDSKKYNFTWTNEVYPIKQGFSVTVTLFGGWGFTMVTAGLFYLTRNIISPNAFLCIMIVLFSIPGCFMYRNLMNEKAAQFSFIK